MKENKAYQTLMSHGVRPSVQRLAIMQYLLSHLTHPTVDEVYQGLCKQIPTLSRTTVYNTLRLFADNKAAQMITIDDHRVCYDGMTDPHVHFFCKQCGKIMNLSEEDAPRLDGTLDINGSKIDEVQLYYKGTCASCLKKAK